jgi:hypothetical protein|uniref:Uncharacterized protein n=1 Tax=viral metagenome TaxID=1070528 RepID=A0A6C0HDK6_9ZZZZ
MDMPPMSVILQSVAALALLIIGIINVSAVSVTTGAAEQRNTSAKNAVRTSQILFAIILVIFLFQSFTLYQAMVPK